MEIKPIKELENEVERYVETIYLYDEECQMIQTDDVHPYYELFSVRKDKYGLMWLQGSSEYGGIILYTSTGIGHHYYYRGEYVVPNISYYAIVEEECE